MIAVPVLLVMVVVLFLERARLSKKSLMYHKLADQRLQDLEPIKMERDEWHQRAEFFREKLQSLERA